jgi:hypothetical protein
MAEKLLVEKPLTIEEKIELLGLNDFQLPILQKSMEIICSNIEERETFYLNFEIALKSGLELQESIEQGKRNLEANKIMQARLAALKSKI